MESNINNVSSIPVPATMSDITVLSTPLPQAASTASRRRSPGLYGESNTATSSELTKQQMDDLLWLSGRHLQPVTPRGSHASLVDEFNALGDFEFRVPSVPSRGPNSQSKVNPDLNLKQKFQKRLSNDAAVKRTSLTPSAKIKSASTTNLNDMPLSLSKGQYSLDRGDCEQLSISTSSRFRHPRDSLQSSNDRISIATASSVNSSLGVIPPDMLDEVQRQSVIDSNHDLSLQLAQKLNLDASFLRDGVDLSTLTNERYKEKLAALEDKENKRKSSSDYWTLHGYSSDNSRNDTAKKLSSLSSGSGGDSESLQKLSPSRRSLKPLSEINFSLSPRKLISKSGRSSVGSNPFSSYSNASVSSEDFQSGEAAMQRLARDESQFSMASGRSLSGIYGDANASFCVDGKKLSMSSYLRTGSEPLGCLGGGDSQQPQFGMASRSPEKTGGPKAILPPPQEKSTFLVDEEPVRDTPWGPHSLVEQFSNIHYSGVIDPDASVPSLSYISQLIDNIQDQDVDPRMMLEKLIGSEGSKKKPHETSMKPNRISSVVEGANSFCQGVDGGPSFSQSGVQDHSLGGAVDDSTTSTCNITDFDGDEEACVCVMTPQSMDFDVFNDLSHPVEHSFTKACYVNGQRKDSAAYVSFPVSKLMLFPGQRRTLTITIAALVGGVIKIKVEVARKNPITQIRECSYVYGKIVAEIPRISLLTQHKAEMMPAPDSESSGKYQHTIVLRNEGRSVVPLKLTLSKPIDDDVTFHFGERSKTAVSIMVEPGQLIKQLVECETPALFSHLRSPDSVIPVEARVDFRLATTDLYQLVPVDPVTLVAPLKPYFFGAPSQMTVPSILTLYNPSDDPVAFKISTEPGYIVQPSNFIIQPQKTFVISVNTTENRNSRRSGELVLHTVKPQAMFSIKLQEKRRSSMSSENSLATPRSSRPPSPTSPGHRDAAVEELKVTCSNQQLVWGGCPFHQSLVKTFCIKNEGRHREKLRLTISSASTCFKIMNEESALQSEIKLSLQPMENREVKVAVLATVAGPQWGHLTISRIGRPTDKNVLPLSAFGGKAKVLLSESIFEIGGNKFIFLDENTLQSSFVLSNTGDSSAFFKISQANVRTSCGLSVSPEESVLASGAAITINISLSVTAERLEYLLRQSTPQVCVAQLSVCFGDESTRQRLIRMRGLDAALSTRLAPLRGIQAERITNLEKLDIYTSGAEGLWHEDTDECVLGIFIKRTALEALRLDTSVHFVNLSKTLSHLP